MKKLAGLLLLCACSLPAQAEEPVLLRFQFQVASQGLGEEASGEVEQTSGQLTLESTRRTEEGAGRQLDVQVPGAATVQLPAGTQWYASLRAPGLWSPRRLLRTVEQGSEFTVVAFPTAKLQGSLQVPVGEEIPEAVSVRFQPVPGELAELSGEVVCPVVKARLDCEIPAGRLDLRLRAVGFVSHYWWEARLPAGGVRELGNVSLLPGASVVGWVESAESGFRTAKVKVYLEPDRAGTSPGDQRQVAALRQESGINERGFFEFTGLPAGSYRVAATHPGMASAVMSSVRVFERAETEIHALTLRPPGELEVVIRPPTDPFHVPWTVRLQRDSPVPGRGDEIAQRRAGAADAEAGGSAAGQVLFEGLEPGLYRLLLRDSRGSSWHWQDVTVSSGVNYEEVVLPIMRLAGTVTLGGEPLPDAEVWFGGRFGARKIGVTTREEGDFYAFLPVQDTWRVVDVWAAGGRIQATFSDVAVPERRQDQRWPEIELKLPDTRIEGEVVDPDGQRVPNAVVVAQRDDVLLDVRASEGKFEFRGMEPGAWSLEAQTIGGSASGSPDGASPRARSEVVGVEVRDGLDSAPLRLVVRPVATVEGQVINDQGHGVPGALVVGIVEQASELRVGMQIPETFTDASGAFELEVPAQAQRVALNVFPLGFAATRVTTTLPGHDTLLIPVQQNGGDILLHFPTDERLGEQRQRTSLFHNGQIVAHPWAQLRWAELHGLGQFTESTFTIPMLEPGTYTACFDLPEAVKITGRLQAGFEEMCVSGELSSYGQLGLNVPATSGN